MGAVRATQQTGSLFCNIDEANTGIGIDATFANNQTLMLVVLNFYEQNAHILETLTLSAVALMAMIAQILTNVARGKPPGPNKACMRGDRAVSRNSIHSGFQGPGRSTR